ncbi:glycosyltransferase family 2 protein [Candidatus Bipolaricaulota bacterium]|nr:glycosyltransferase family 2 protein [Candidatus Bipolaricaulota bacterium]
MKISAIVPAYNEAARIGAVLTPLLAAPSVAEVIVVDDGSTDGTAEVARRYGVKVVRLAENRGKGAAMAAGVRAASGDTLLFLDADLTGLTAQHVEDLVRAYKEGEAEVVIAVFRKGRAATDLSQMIVPFLSGQRIMPKKLWERAEALTQAEDFGIEMALTKLAFREGWRQKTVVWEGVSHVRKEEKRGFWQGFIERLKMYANIVRSIFRRF